MSYGVGHRCGLDPTLLWLWHRPEATAPIRPLAWEPLYAMGVVLEKTKKRYEKTEMIGRKWILFWEYWAQLTTTYSGDIITIYLWIHTPTAPCHPASFPLYTYSFSTFHIFILWRIVYCWLIRNVYKKQTNIKWFACDSSWGKHAVYLRMLFSFFLFFFLSF